MQLLILVILLVTAPIWLPYLAALFIIALVFIGSLTAQSANDIDKPSYYEKVSEYCESQPKLEDCMERYLDPEDLPRSY